MSKGFNVDDFPDTAAKRVHGLLKEGYHIGVGIHSIGDNLSELEQTLTGFRMYANSETPFCHNCYVTITIEPAGGNESRVMIHDNTPDKSCTNRDHIPALNDELAEKYGEYCWRKLDYRPLIRKF